jgi:hypothetical protein
VRAGGIESTLRLKILFLDTAVVANRQSLGIIMKDGPSSARAREVEQWLHGVVVVVESVQGFKSASRAGQEAPRSARLRSLLLFHWKGSFERCFYLGG